MDTFTKVDTGIFQKPMLVSASRPGERTAFGRTRFFSSAKRFENLSFFSLALMDITFPVGHFHLAQTKRSTKLFCFGFSSGRHGFRLDTNFVIQSGEQNPAFGVQAFLRATHELLKKRMVYFFQVVLR